MKFNANIEIQFGSHIFQKSLDLSDKSKVLLGKKTSLHVGVGCEYIVGFDFSLGFSMGIIS